MVRREASHQIVCVRSVSRLICKGSDAADAFGSHIIGVCDGGRAERTGLSRVSLAAHAMQRVIAVADDLGGRAGLIWGR